MNFALGKLPKFNEFMTLFCHSLTDVGPVKPAITR